MVTELKVLPVAAPFCVSLCSMGPLWFRALSSSTGSAMQVVRGKQWFSSCLSGVLNKGLSHSMVGCQTNGALQRIFFSSGASAPKVQRCGMETSLVCTSWVYCPLTSMYTGWQLSPPHEPWGGHPIMGRICTQWITGHVGGCFKKGNPIPRFKTSSSRVLHAYQIYTVSVLQFPLRRLGLSEDEVLS